MLFSKREMAFREAFMGQRPCCNKYAKGFRRPKAAALNLRLDGRAALLTALNLRLDGRDSWVAMILHGTVRVHGVSYVKVD